MKLGACVIAIGLATTIGWGQAATERKSINGALREAYSIQGATVEQESLLREAVQAMRPVVLPSRIVFEPHWKYLYATKMFHLHVPAGMASQMFTHLASRSVFVDVDYCSTGECLSRCIAHELGHLEHRSASESDAEKAASIYRRNLRDATRKRAK